MGITGFYSWITENYANSLNVPPSSENLFYNHIYIDLNYLLHMCTYNSPTINMTIHKIQTMIMDICGKHHALETINICCDGSAPLAKLLLQRSRRLQEARTMCNNSIINLKNSTLNFTPGSKFMSELHIVLNNLKLKLESSLNVKVLINNLDSGEAEIKIKYLINKHNDLDPNSKHLLVTNDADVLLILAATKIYKNMFVLLKSNKILSLNKLIDSHTNKFGKSNTPQYDFAFLNLLNGNDYLPKIKYTTVDRIWEAYARNLKKYPNGLVLNKDQLTGRFDINSKFLISIIKSISVHISPNVIKKTRLDEYNFDVYTKYVDGLIWCFQMYFTGRCDYNSYIFDSTVSPDPNLLMLHLMQNDINLHFNLKPTKPICNKLCSILLLPNIAKELIDEKYYEFMDLHSYLYAEEKCEECQKYYQTMSETNKEYKDGGCTDTKLKKKISVTQKAYESHRSTHIRLSGDDIEKIKSEYESKVF
jgi:5'-3' exonuclease